MTYRVEFTPRAEKELLRLDFQVRDRILKNLRKLAADPFASAGIKALTGGGYRLRVGDYRVLYAVEADVMIVLVVGVGHRREVYRRR